MLALETITEATFLCLAPTSGLRYWNTSYQRRYQGHLDRFWGGTGSSVMVIKKLKLSAKVPDKYFTTRYLERF